MPETRSISAERRDRVGKGSARQARRAGRVPAVIYGGGDNPQSITLAFNELVAHINRGRFTSTLYEIEVGGSKERVLPRDVQFNVVTDLPIHVDFLRISRGKRVAVMIPVQFVNEEESPGIRRGGVLNVVRHEVELMCPGDAIPDWLEADLTGLDINDGVHISMIDLPQNVTPTITDRDFTIATIAAPTLMTEPEEEEAEEGEEVPEGEEEGVEAAEGEGEEEGEGEGEAENE